MPNPKSKIVWYGLLNLWYGLWYGFDLQNHSVLPRSLRVYDLGPMYTTPPRLPPLNIMDLSSNLPKWLTPLNLPTLSGNLHQIAPAQIQDCNLVQIPPSEIAPISTELHQTALNCTDLASKSFLHRRKHPFPMTIGHQRSARFLSQAGPPACYAVTLGVTLGRIKSPVFTEFVTL